MAKPCICRPHPTTGQRWSDAACTEHGVPAVADELLTPPRPTASWRARLFGAELTPREHQVLGYIAQGMTNQKIGQLLFLSEDTVKTHARRLFSKLGARDRAHAVAKGYQLGLLALPTPATTGLRGLAAREHAILVG